MGGGAKIAESMGGTRADAQLTGYVAEAADALGVPAPENVFIVDAREPNAFAASNLLSQSTTVAVTTGLRSALTPRELKAVLAHEMGHLRSNDVVRNMHVAVAVAGFGGVYNSGRWLLESAGRSSRKDKDDDDSSSSAGAGLALMAAGLGAQGLAQLLRLAASRDAEIKADRAAAEAFGSDAMISALKKIDALAARRPADLRASPAGEAFAFAMISDGASGDVAKAAGEGKGAARSWTSVFDPIVRALRTHPPLDVRVAALEEATASGIVPASGPKAGDSWF